MGEGNQEAIYQLRVRLLSHTVEAMIEQGIKSTDVSAIILEYTLDPEDKSASTLTGLIDLAESLNREVVIRLVPRKKISGGG